MESEFLSIGNSIFLFTAFFSSKIRFNKAEIRISLKNTFPLDGKKSCSCLRKMERKKMFCTIQKISFPPARMSSFSKNYFRLIPVMVSTSSEIALFPLGRKSICNSWVKDIEKYVSAIRKSCFHFKKYLMKLVSTSRNVVRLSKWISP